MAIDLQMEPAPTGREAFLQEVEALLAAARKSGGPVCFALVDMDLQGRLNQRLGRVAGEAAIERLGAALAEALPAARVARVGGDAFGVAWAVEKEAAFLALEQFRTSFDDAHTLAGQRAEVELQVSVGLAAYPDDGAAASDLFAKASGALYRAKATGRNKVCLAREEKMVTKTSHYTQGQLMGLRRLAEREGIKDAELLREALNDLLRKYNA